MFSKNPVRKIKKALTTIFFNEATLSVSLYLAKANERAVPTMNRKKGKTRSVGVQPLHAACFKGEKTLPQDPGLLTKIIPAIVMPLSTSRAVYLLDAVVSIV